MYHTFLLAPFVFTAIRALALGFAQTNEAAPKISAEAEYRVLTAVTIALIVLLVSATMMSHFPGISELIAECDNF